MNQPSDPQPEKAHGRHLSGWLWGPSYVNQQTLGGAAENGRKREECIIKKSQTRTGGGRRVYGGVLSRGYTDAGTKDPLDLH